MNTDYVILQTTEYLSDEQLKRLKEEFKNVAGLNAIILQGGMHVYPVRLGDN
jgi:hypothetical protein